jgi:hypothetical protein
MPASMILACTDPVPAAADDVYATDNCEGTIYWRYMRNACFPDLELLAFDEQRTADAAAPYLFTLNRTWIASDLGGNSLVYSQILKVRRYWAVLGWVGLGCAAQCRAVLCCAVLCCAVLCCAVLCCGVPCCALLCCLSSAADDAESWPSVHGCYQPCSHPCHPFQWINLYMVPPEVGLQTDVHVHIHWWVVLIAAPAAPPPSLHLAKRSSVMSTGRRLHTCTQPSCPACCLLAACS